MTAIFIQMKNPADEEAASVDAQDEFEFPCVRGRRTPIYQHRYGVLKVGAL